MQSAENEMKPRSADEQSMDEILASIRRMLNDETAPAGAAEGQGTADGTEDVLLLDQTMLIPLSPPQPAISASVRYPAAGVAPPPPLADVPAITAHFAPPPPAFAAETTVSELDLGAAPPAPPTPHAAEITPPPAALDEAPDTAPQATILEPLVMETVTSEPVEMADTVAPVSADAPALPQEAEVTAPPGVAISQSDAPQIDALQIDALQSDVPQIDVPQIDGPQSGVPQPEAPKVDTDAAVTAALEKLVERLSAERLFAVTRAAPTLEDLVRDEIRPVLKTWLDANLPAMVEKLVKAEIALVVKAATQP